MKFNIVQNYVGLLYCFRKININDLSTPKILMRPGCLFHSAFRRPSSFMPSLLLLVLYMQWHLHHFTGASDLTSS